MLLTVVKSVSSRARIRRAKVLQEYFKPLPQWRILDLGGGTGEHFKKIFPDLTNVVICDYSSDDLRKARELGFDTVLADGSDRLPFADREFDLVFCSSVIEHVTGPKEVAINTSSTEQFKKIAFAHQAKFASEIIRISKRFYVQTPHKYFPVESHTCLPMPIVLLSRPMQIRAIAFFNKFWPKRTAPDWNLLVTSEMQGLFPGARVLLEKSVGLPKSIMAFGTTVGE